MIIENKFLSKLALGSAQWGSKYGISNICGKTSLEELTKIIKIARSSGIDLIDTAPVYGDAESKLGNLNLDEFKFVTKTKKFISNKLNQIDLENLDIQFKTSIKNLRTNNIYGLLFHSSEDLLKEGGEKLISHCQKFKKEGYVEKIGLSIYDSNNLEKILKKFIPDIVQLPVNIFDQVSLSNGTLKELKEKGVEIHARSIFLQGLLLMDSHNIPKYFHKWKIYFEKLEKLCQKNNISKLEAAINFISKIEYIDRFIIGFENSKQLEQCLEFLNNKSVINFSELAINDPNITNPQNWKI